MFLKKFCVKENSFFKKSFFGMIFFWCFFYVEWLMFWWIIFAGLRNSNDTEAVNKCDFAGPFHCGPYDNAGVIGFTDKLCQYANPMVFNVTTAWTGAEMRVRSVDQLTGMWSPSRLHRNLLDLFLCVKETEFVGVRRNEAWNFSLFFRVDEMERGRYVWFMISGDTIMQSINQSSKELEIKSKLYLKNQSINQSILKFKKYAHYQAINQSWNRKNIYTIKQSINSSII